MIKLGEFFVLLCKTSYHATLDLHLTIVSKHQCRQTSTQPTQVNLMPYAPTVPTIAMPCVAMARNVRFSPKNMKN